MNYVNPGPQMYSPNAFPANQNQQRPGMPWGPPMASYPAPYSYGPQMPQSTPINNGGPSLSAVKIDINGASMDSGGSAKVGNPMPMYPGRSQMMSPQMPPMAYPQFPPTQYMQPSGYPQYPFRMPQQETPPIAYQQAPPIQYMPQPQQVAPMPVAPNVVYQQPNVPPQPTVVNQQNNQQNVNTAPTPPPSQIDQQPQAEQVDPVVQPLVQALDILNPKAGQTNTAEEQSMAIHSIAQFAKTAQAAENMIKADPNNQEAIAAKEKVSKLIQPLLIKEETFKGLANIATKDTSSLSGAEKQKADENKIISMWTLAMLQKSFRTEMDQELKNRNIEAPPMPIGEVPGVSEIVKNIKTDPNPDVREGGIVALMEVADPKNPKDVETMKVILEIAAKQDSAETVKTTAKNALKEFK